jgi:hypothetical protein
VDLHRGKWRARIHAGGHPVHLGEFASAEDAATAYDVVAIAAFGEYACLNFPRLSHLS